MTRFQLLTAGAVGVAITVAVAATAPATPQPPAQASYEVTVTNLTPAQIFAPILVATHDGSTSMFEAGGVASPELGLLAEEGDTSQLFGALQADAGVHDVASGTGMIHPGASETIVIDGARTMPYLSLAGMLVTTNDTFVGVDSVLMPVGKDSTFFAFGYDAGTEANSELCAYIPGPPCGSAGAHDPAPAEGFIAVSNGVHGIGDVNAAAYDWRGPVARIEVRRR